MKLGLLGAVALFAGTPATAQMRPSLVFRCNLGAKIVEVVQANGAFTYRYGKPGATPEIELRSNGHDGNLTYEMARHYDVNGEIITFKNGAFHYEMSEMQMRNGKAFATFNVSQNSNGNEKAISERTCLSYKSNIGLFGHLIDDDPGR